MENFRYSNDMDGYIYATQLMQSEAVASAYRVWRRNWKGHGKEYSAGVLVWQVRILYTTNPLLPSLTLPLPHRPCYR